MALEDPDVYTQVTTRRMEGVTRRDRRLYLSVGLTSAGQDAIQTVSCRRSIGPDEPPGCKTFS